MRRRCPAPSGPAAGAAVLAVLLAAALCRAVGHPAGGVPSTDDYVGALQAARAGIVDVASFDYVTLDDDIEQINVTTGDLQQESVDQLDQQRQQLTDAQAVVDTTVVGAAVGEADDDSATVFAVIQSTQKTKASRRRRCSATGSRSRSSAWTAGGCCPGSPDGEPTMSEQERARRRVPGPPRPVPGRAPTPGGRSPRRAPAPARCAAPAAAGQWRGTRRAAVETTAAALRRSPRPHPAAGRRAAAGRGDDARPAARRCRGPSRGRLGIAAVAVLAVLCVLGAAGGGCCCGSGCTRPTSTRRCSAPPGPRSRRSTRSTTPTPRAACSASSTSSPVTRDES